MISLTETVHVAGMMGEIARSREATNEVLYEIIGAQLPPGGPARKLSLQDLAHDHGLRRPTGSRGSGQSRVQLWRHFASDRGHGGIVLSSGAECNTMSRFAARLANPKLTLRAKKRIQAAVYRFPGRNV
jgi:hypothetical protein